MDFNYSPQEEAFREEVRDWLRENMKEIPRWRSQAEQAGLKPDSDDYQHQFGIWWHRKLNDAGFVGLAWPKEYGGRGANIMEQVVFNEEMAKHRSPGPTNGMGLGWVGPALLANGTEEQKQRFLPKILNAEEIWCTLYSEPEAGSDMANVKTRAVEDGDDFVVNGQKVWTSGGHLADWAVLLARTDPDAPKHRGLSYFLMDMRSPGVTVRPLVNITGGHEFNETFLDDVRVPKNQLLGEKNRGWYVAMGALEFERSGIGASIGRESTIKALIRMARATVRNGQPLSQDRAIRHKLAQFYIEANVSKYVGLRNLTHQLRGERPGPEGSVGHIFGVEFNQRLQDFAMQLQGMHSQLTKGSKYAIDNGRWQYSFLRARANSIETGTSEIQRNVVAQRALGLPRQ
jgi:alkylation response protein AidB-like acyl-CoA dehydrogenase